MAGGLNTLRNQLLRPLDVVRGIPGLLGFRLYTVNVVVRTWTGSRPGVDNSTSSDATTNVKVDVGTYPTKVRQLTQREIIASGGIYSDQDMKVGPITPPYTGSTQDNDAIAVFDPLPTTSATEVFFKITGPGMLATGSWFKKVGQDVSAPMHYEFTVRRTGEAP